LKNVIRKGDIILLVVLILFGLALSWVSVRSNITGQKVIVRVGGKEYGTYMLDKNRTITIRQNGHKNIIEIKDGKAVMKYSDCKNQICVNHSEISSTRETIVCLPNKVTLEIEGKDNGGDQIDAKS